MIIPIRGRGGRLRGVLRYAPSHDRAPKVLAVRGTRLGLIPHPCTESSRWVVLVEGPPDMISARSRGLPAIAVPGDDAWEAESVGMCPVVLTATAPGGRRQRGSRLISRRRACTGAWSDLARARADGYDLTEWLAKRERLGEQELRRTLAEPGARPRAGVPAARR